MTDGDRLMLRTISVRNLRSLHDIPATALETDLTILAGQNGGGKTSFIDALAMLLESSVPNASALSSTTPDGEDVVVTGVFSSEDAGENVIVRSTRVQNRVRREVLRAVHPDFGAPPEGMTLPALRAVFAASNIPSPGGVALAPFVKAAGQWISERPPAELVDEWVDLPSDIAVRLPHLTVFRSQDADNQLARVDRLIAQESQRLLSSAAYTPQLAAVAAEVQAAVDPVLDLIKKMIRQYCPIIEDIEISTAFDFSRVSPQVRIQLKRVGGDPIAMNEAGSGILQRVGLAIYAANLATLQGAGGPSSGTVLAYDEPDTHLDYQAQRELFEIIRSQSDLAHVQVVVATHSVNLIDRVRLDCVRHFYLDNQRTIIECINVQNDEREAAFVEAIASGLGPRNSILLSEKCFLVAEGPTEEMALPILFRKATGQSLTSAGVTLLNTGGSGGVRRLVEVLIQRMKREVIVLVDEDARNSPAAINSEWFAKTGLVEGENGFFVGTKEFEDAFDDAVWLRVALDHFPNHPDEPPWVAADFHGPRADSAGMGDALVRLFSTRTHRRVTKPQLGETLARVAERDEIPEKIASAIKAVLAFAEQG